MSDVSFSSLSLLMTEMQHLDNNTFARVIATLKFARVIATDEFDFLWQIRQIKKATKDNYDV